MEDYATYITIGLAAFVWIIGVYLLSKYSSSFQLWRRALALLIGLSGLALLIIKPNYTQTKIPIQAHLGSDFHNSQDSLPFQFSGVHDLISDPNYERIDTIIIHGLGISPEDLSLTADIPIVWQKPDSIRGITSIVPSRYYVNEVSQLQGQYTGGITNISLQASNGMIYPAILSDTSFTIAWTPNVSGDHIFDMIGITSSGDTIQELLPLHIHKEAKWNLLALLSYPSAEFNQMKNYWTQLGNGIANRTQIAHERYSTSFTNLAEIDLSTIKGSLLSQFDLIVLQGQQWNNQTETDRNRILYQVANKGLGLLILQEELDQKFYLLNNPSATETEITQLNTIPLRSPLQALQLNSKSGWQEIIYDNNVISSVKNYGLGKIQILGLSDTYKLKLEGRQKAYQQIWSQVFSAIFTDFNTDNTLIKPAWIQSGQIQELQLLHDRTVEDISITHNGIATDFLRTPNIADHITLHVRPKPGRNTIRITDSGEEFSYFAHSDSSWSSSRTNHFATQLEQTQLLPKRDLQEQYEDKPYSPFWCLLLFVGGFGMLWLDERVFQ